MSAELLYDDIKAENEFHSLINAAVSHELRNPLNSMICQIFFMNHNLARLKRSTNKLNPQSITEANEAIQDF